MSNTPALALRLFPSGATLPEGMPIKAVGDESATMRVSGTRVEVDMVIPSQSAAEIRWVVDGVLRSVQRVVPFESASLAAEDGVDPSIATTIALDLHHRMGGKLEAPSAIAKTATEIGGLEDGFRAWVNEDPSTRTSLAIAKDVNDWAAGRDAVDVQVLEEDALRERGLRLLLAVGQGSEASPPRLVMAHYRPSGKEDVRPTMLLGKGITFDSGGINVKPYESFVSTMKNDMAGAALAFHLFRGLVEAEHPEPLVLVIPTCENAVGSRSMRPGAVVKSYAGHTVRIDHTDAEGRLVLADGLAYALEQYEPEQVICFATLTTAALIAYGPYATPVHFAGADLQQKLQAASETMGEDLHFFPERIWHAEANRDKWADLRNTARLPADASRGAGSRNAAHFVKQFCPSVPLCHFDIFASAWNWAGDAPGAGYGATGAPLRTLIEALRQ